MNRGNQRTRGKVWRLWQDYWEALGNTPSNCPPLVYVRDGATHQSAWFATSATSEQVDDFMAYLVPRSDYERLRKWQKLNDDLWLNQYEWFGLWSLFEVVGDD